MRISGLKGSCYNKDTFLAVVAALVSLGGVVTVSADFEYEYDCVFAKPVDFNTLAKELEKC